MIIFILYVHYVECTKYTNPILTRFQIYYIHRYKIHIQTSSYLPFWGLNFERLYTEFMYNTKIWVRQSLPR